jgi:hypothetical protein
MNYSLVMFLALFGGGDTVMENTRESFGENLEAVRGSLLRQLRHRVINGSTKNVALKMEAKGLCSLIGLRISPVIKLQDQPFQRGPHC